MANTNKRQRGPMDPKRRGARKTAKAGDLPATADGAAKGGVYQHNQSDLEFLKAGAIKGGSKNDLAIETIEIAHVGITPR